MPFMTAIENLVRARFSCDDRVSAPLVTCTLDRQSLLPYACFERVKLTTVSERRTVTPAQRAGTVTTAACELSDTWATASSDCTTVSAYLVSKSVFEIQN